MKGESLQLSMRRQERGRKNALKATKHTHRIDTEGP